MRFFSKYSLLFFLGIATWVPILIINFYYWIQAYRPSFGDSMAPYIMFPPFLPPWVRQLAFAAFFLANFILIEQIIRRIEKWDVIDLLWKLLVIGISGISVTFLFQILEESMRTDKLYPYIKTLSASIKLYAFLVFLFSTIFIFRKLILYQKNKRKVISWYIFLGILFLGMLRLFMVNDSDLALIYRTAMMTLFIAISLVLSANVNWSAYLNFNQKLKSLFLVFIIVLLFVAFFQNLPFDALPDTEDLPTLMTREYLVLGFFFLFPLIYTLISGLVLIFNLPTSSVFEQRSSELATMQRINQSIQANLDEEEILITLMDASLLTSNATGGWIEKYIEPEEADSNAEPKSTPDHPLAAVAPASTGPHIETEIFYQKNVSQDEIFVLREKEDITSMVISTGKFTHYRNLRKQRNFRYARTRIRSLLALPIMTREKPIGVLHLINELPGSFEEETIFSLVGLTEQAGIAIENAELVSRSLDFERYNEQVKIAKQFQERILPSVFPENDQIEFYAKSQEADEIGGDYYDVHQNGSLFKVALGDVSGKGTTAAFYMAETKGIFQALTHLDIGVKEFIIRTNEALSKCLAKGSFMTLTYLHIDLEARMTEVVRAGHCPTLYYHAERDELKYYDQGGIGLAIIRDEMFKQFITEPERIPMAGGDLMILFTDGIMEARNTEKEEFGLDKIRDIVWRHRRSGSKVIGESLLQEVKQFSGGKIDDDYSILVIKFL